MIRDLARELARRGLSTIYPELRRAPTAPRRAPPTDPACTYDADHLKVWHKDTGFLRAPRFVRAYGRGMRSGHKIGRPKGSDADIHIEWRVHVCCWAAWHAKHLPGDFVECGVNSGIFSLALCDYIDFNSTGKDFFLFDTYRGVPAEQVSEAERALGRLDESEAHYEECYELTRASFASFPRVRLVRGLVPATLHSVEIPRVAYLSIDMNIAAPELAAMEHFWPRLVTGAVVVLDDYGWSAFGEQKRALDGFARRQGIEILTLPTGQGLILKP